ncbi:MAG: hypothetical protein HUU15_01685 [Candidatus Brocadiae bacterium]|nr:hypothetical protein [Candidatus Brocadiia bacterium]
MNVLDGLSKQFNGRGLQARLVLEGVAWFADMHKMLSTFSDDIRKFAEGAAAGPDDVQKWLQKASDTGKTLWTHLGQDATALALMADVSSKRKPEDLGVEGAPSYMREGAGNAKALAEALDRKVAECGVLAAAWTASGIPAHVSGMLEAGGTVRGTIELVGGETRLTDGELDDRLFEVHYAATGQVGNRHLQEKPGAPGLMAATAALLKEMKREMLLVKAPSR